MPSDEKQVQIPADLQQEENRDVADLWKDALKAYKGIVGFDLERKFDNVQAMIDQGTKEMNNFHSFRHNDKKVDKLRSLFANNLDYIQKGANQLIAAATPAFPPAAAIGTAITFMLGVRGLIERPLTKLGTKIQYLNYFGSYTACRDQRADYDLVVVFFEDMNSFLQRVVILETRLPGHKAYQNCLMDVFTSFLTMCGYAHKYIELGRFKKWISNLLSGGDSDLSGARKTMDLKLTRLQNATEFAILGNTEDLKRMNSELQQNSDLHTAMLEDQKEVMSSIQENTETIRNDMAKLLKAFTDQKKESSAKKKSSNFNSNKSASANRIRNLFVEIEGEDHEYYVLKDTIIPDTCNWVFDEPQWEQWHTSDDPSPVLAISGDPGVGKSHIGASVYDKLLKEVEADADKTLCAAHFYFREQASDLHTFGNAVNIIVIQVVEQNEQICEMVLAEFNKDETFIDYQDPEDVFRKLLVPIFRKDSKYHLKLMLDGIDELEDFQSLIKFLEIIRDEQLRISVVVTSRPERVKGISEANIPTISIPVDKEKQKLDLRELIWNRLNSLSPLRTFSRYVKQRVADKLEEHSPNMLYAENMLHRFNSLGREAAVLRTLEKPLPADLDELYEILVAECYKHLIPEHKSLVDRLLHWVAHKQSLTLDEVNSLLRLWTNDNKFDIDEIPDSILNLIRIGDPGADAEQRAKVKVRGFWGTAVEELDKTNADPDAMYNDGDLPVKFHERSMRAFFCETTGKEESRRWKPSETKRQLFFDLASILCREDEGVTITPSLKAYIFEKMLHFWRDIDPQSHTVEEQAQVMDTFASILLNKSGFAELYCKQELGEINPYTEMFNDESFEKVSTWASLLEDVKPSLSDDVAQWWASLNENPRDCFLQLLKAHVKILYGTGESVEIVKAFNAIECLVELRPMDDKIAERAKANFGDQAADEDVTPQQRLAMALENLFDDIPMTPNAYRAVGVIQFGYTTPDNAYQCIQKALEMEDDVVGRFESQHAIAQVLVKKEAYDEAYTYVTKAMENVDHDAIAPSDRRDAWSIKGSIEVLLGNNDEAARSFAQSRKSDPTGLTPGEALVEEINLFSTSSPQRFIEILKDWSPLERLTYLAYEFQESGRLLHSHVRDAALKTHEEQFVLEVYEDTIKHLDNVKAAAPIQVELALFHWQVRNDPHTASKVLDQVLESGSNLWLYAITNANPIDILGRAVTYQCDIAWKFFQESSDPEVKAELLESIRTILSRPLALDVPPNMSNAHRPLAMAKMYFKMGPVIESQKILQNVVNNCIDHLSDTVDWNDARNLVFLAKVLHILSKKVKSKSEELTRVARILVSAQLSCLDPEISQKDEEESEAGLDTPAEEDKGSKEPGETPSQPDEKQPDDPLPDESLPDEGDLIPGERMCEGECNPSKGFHGFGNQVAYQCMHCFEGFLCEQCYESRVGDGPKTLASKTLVHCDKGHDFLKMPIEGWHGVKDGKIMIEGEEPLEFKELLQQVRELCKGAWDEFWQG